jgi:hypothetical protein
MMPNLALLFDEPALRASPYSSLRSVGAPYDTPPDRTRRIKITPQLRWWWYSLWRGVLLVWRCSVSGGASTVRVLRGGFGGATCCHTGSRGASGTEAGSDRAWVLAPFGGGRRDRRLKLPARIERFF